MSKVNDLIASNMPDPTKKVKKTRNHDLFLKTIISVCEDDEHVSKFVKNVTSEGELITEDRKLASEFRKILARALKERTSMTMDEALNEVKNFRLTSSEADTLVKVLMSAIDININKLGKKVQIVATPEMSATISSVKTHDMVKKNPKDPTKETLIKARMKMKAETATYAFQKVSRKKK